MFTIGLYNLGVQQTMLDTDTKAKADAILHAVCGDVREAFHNHQLDTMGLCELGSHGDGLEGGLHFDCQNQEQLMKLVVEMINNQVGAQEPNLVLVSGDIPSYAFHPPCRLATPSRTYP